MIKQWISATCVATLCSLANGQVQYDDIQKGSLIKDGQIGLGSFTTPLPLPPGEWLVVDRQDRTIELSKGHRFPMIDLGQVNSNPEASIPMVLLSFSPDIGRVNWTNTACESKYYPLINDFGTHPGSPLYLCGMVMRRVNQKKYLLDSASNSNTWAKTRLPPFAAHVESIGDNLLWASMVANRFEGRSLTYTFGIKLSETSFAADTPLYQYTQSWLQQTGISVGQFLEGKKVALPPFTASH